MSINLRESVETIITGNPEHAEPLYDVLLFMARPKAALTPDFDATAEMLYSMTEDSRRHREIYEKKRAAA